MTKNRFAGRNLTRAKPNNQCADLDDGIEIRRAKDALLLKGFDFEQPSPNQLKIGPLNFYPRTGTIYRDCDQGALQERGLKAFMQIARRFKYQIKRR